MTATEPVYEPGDVVYGVDPFGGTSTGRPWLIVSNHAGKPFHGEQYIALSLTTKTWHDGLIDIAASSWNQGGTPDSSRIIPWAVQSLDRDDIDYWQGRVADPVVTEAVDELIRYVQL